MDWQIDAIGVVSAAELLTYDRYWDEISRGVPEGLGYLVRNASCRKNFEALLPGTRSVVCCALRMPELPADLRPYLARFCSFGDYHAVVRERLAAFGEMLCARFGVKQFRVCVDSAPILERELAVRAGLGEIGYNRMVIHPVLGAFVVLGEILVDVDLTAHAEALSKLSSLPLVLDAFALLEPGKHGCCAAGHRLCVQACPTGALSASGYDMGRCLAYWTTQYKGEIPEIYALAMGGCFWGCDRCQLACPRAMGKKKDAARMSHQRHSAAPGAYAAEGRIAPASDNLTSDNLTSDNLISDNLISDNLTSDNLISDNLISDNLTSDNLTSEEQNGDKISTDSSIPGETEALIEGMRWSKMLEMSANGLRRGLSGSAMGSAHPYMVQRNLCIVIGNLRYRHYASVLSKLVETHACEWVRSAALRALKMFEQDGGKECQ